MNLLDVIIGIIGAVVVVKGYRRGFVLQLSNFAGFLLALYAAYRLSADVGDTVRAYVPFSVESMSGSPLLSLLPVDAVLYRIAAFILLFVIVRYVVRRIGGMLNGVFKLPVLNAVNRFAGVIVAVLQVLLITYIAVTVLNFLPGPKMQTLLNESWIAGHLLNLFPSVSDWVESWLNVAEK